MKTKPEKELESARRSVYGKLLWRMFTRDPEYPALDMSGGRAAFRAWGRTNAKAWRQVRTWHIGNSKKASVDVAEWARAQSRENKQETEAKSWKISKEVRWSKAFGFYSNGGRKQLEGFEWRLHDLVFVLKGSLRCSISAAHTLKLEQYSED